MKKCNTCKESKPYEMFSKNKSNKDGYQNKCKVCSKAYKKAYRKANKEKIAKAAKAYYEVNKEGRAKYQKAYREANKEKIAESNKAYREANKEKISDVNKAYRKANKEKVAKYQKAYREANKEKVSEKSSRRRARKRNAIPKFLRNCGVEKQRLRDIYKLRELLSVATGVEYHVDHMWPLADNGPHWSGNLQIITAQENLSKNAKVCKVTKKNIQDSLRIVRKEYEEATKGK